MTSQPRHYAPIVNQNGKAVSIRCRISPKPIRVTRGAVYYLHVWPDGLEERVRTKFGAFGSGRVRGVLEVYVVAVGARVIERTFTFNRDGVPVGPRGRGWELKEGGAVSAIWRRARDWEVVA